MILDRLQTFVQNRVTKIQNLTDISRWQYIKSKDNPADLASRGIFPKTFLNSQLWFHGPSWMTLPNTQWPKNSFSKSEVKLPELKGQVFATILTENNSFPFNKFSSLTKSKRTVAYCLRFIANCRTVNENREVGQLTVTEIDKAIKCLVKLCQKESYNDEIQLLQSSQGLKPKHKLLNLAPFVDSDGLLRVGGRLKHSQLPFSAKHPLLLSGKHILSKLIFEDAHKALLHAGPQLLLATVRQTYWVTSGMNVAKKGY
ncbi:hypothetical protein NQ314_019961 [Rhamnusium bicolor]|uniref:Uncharacterized protein n=1 Tax=Rhamnusium bicolor TaxID=1586634 RepID=A0AAV8WM42_9CUCU|nr:hypothetical protein NQ314_019961 [Rhamnusium bicolor]